MADEQYRSLPQKSDDEEYLGAHAEEQHTARQLELPASDVEPEITNERLSYIENLLRNAPLVSVSVGFADRVMAALRGEDNQNPTYRNGLGIALGLLFSILFLMIGIGIPSYLFLMLVVTVGRSKAVEQFRETAKTIFVPIEQIALTPPIVVMLLGLSFIMLLLTIFVIRFVRDTLS